MDCTRTIAIWIKIVRKDIALQRWKFCPSPESCFLCAFTTIIIRIGCCIAVEMFSTSYQFSERNLFALKSFEIIREGLV